ncbi:kinase-like protein, partial [Sporormia fimetaria CBS 119925]
MALTMAHQSPADPLSLKQNYILVEELSRGGDGAVQLFKRRNSYLRGPRQVAVKISYSKSARQIKTLREEALLMVQLSQRKCPHLLDIIGCDPMLFVNEPMVYFEYCEFGDLESYGRRLMAKFGRIPEESVWKLFSDIAQGLHVLHNDFQKPLIHGDLKSGNILVSRDPRDTEKSGLPTLPIFKIGDFGRTRFYLDDFPFKFNGTPEFSPPLEEQKVCTPAADIWCLGATIQAFALRIMPVQSNKDFVKDYLFQTGIDLRTASMIKVNELLLREEWRLKIPCVYRPLNATPGALKQFWDWPEGMKAPETPYSTALEHWYAGCMEKDTKKRFSARYLNNRLVPVAKREIRKLMALREVEPLQKIVVAANGKAGEAKSRNSPAYYRCRMEDRRKQYQACQLLPEPEKHASSIVSEYQACGRRPRLDTPLPGYNAYQPPPSYQEPPKASPGKQIYHRPIRLYGNGQADSSPLPIPTPSPTTSQDPIIISLSSQVESSQFDPSPPVLASAFNEKQLLVRNHSPLQGNKEGDGIMISLSVEDARHAIMNEEMYEKDAVEIDASGAPWWKVEGLGWAGRRQRVK